jgi:hypothetical protein
MRLRWFFLAFLDGFTPGWWGNARRPGAPEYLFAQEEVSEDEPDDALRGGKQPLNG